MQKPPSVPPTPAPAAVVAIDGELPGVVLPIPPGTDFKFESLPDGRRRMIVGPFGVVLMTPWMDADQAREFATAAAGGGLTVAPELTAADLAEARRALAVPR